MMYFVLLQRSRSQSVTVSDDDSIISRSASVSGTQARTQPATEGMTINSSIMEYCHEAASTLPPPFCIPPVPLHSLPPPSSISIRPFIYLHCYNTTCLNIVQFTHSVAVQDDVACNFVYLFVWEVFHQI